MNPIRTLVILALFATLAACGGGGGGTPIAPAGILFQAADSLVSSETGTSARNPAVCCDGRTVYAVWRDDRNDIGGNEDVFFSRSLDGGETWSTAVRLDTDGAGTSDVDRTRICCSGANVYVVWEDFRNGNKDLYLNASSDGGQTWFTTDVRIDTDTAGAATSHKPKICCDGLGVCVVWEDARNDAGDIYFNASTDGGVTWGTDKRVNTDLTVAAQVDPDICCDRPYIYVVWEDERNGNEDIYYNWSPDGGANFQTADSRVSQDVPGVSLDPSICCDGANVYIAWEDTRNGGLRDIYFDYSRDRGVSWLLNDLRIDSDAVGSGFSNDVKLCCSGSNVYAIWQDQRDSPGTAFIDDIWFNVSNDGGITWRKDVRLNTNAPGTSESVAHKLCCSGENVFATWVDFRAGEKDIHMNWSTDAGHSFQIADLRVNTDTPGAPEQEDSWICCDGDDVYLVWGDHRDGNRSIRARGTR